MKKTITNGLYVAVGIVLGVLSMVVAKPLAQAQQPMTVKPTQVMTLEQLRQTDDVYFLKDARTQGCWLFVRSAGGSTGSPALSPAPQGACGF